MDPLIIRAIERMLVVLIGGLSVYLGYRLFLAVPAQKDSAGKLTLPAGVSVVLSRVGPGVFFALFGTGVIVASLHYTLTLEPIVVSPSGAEIARPMTGVRINYSIDPGTNLNSSRAQLRRDLRTIGSLIQSVNSDMTPLPPERRKELEDAIGRISQASLLSVWANDWGDYATFAEWAKRGDGSSPDGVNAEAVTFYRQSHEVADR